MTSRSVNRLTTSWLCARLSRRTWATRDRRRPVILAERRAASPSWRRGSRQMPRVTPSAIARSSPRGGLMHDFWDGVASCCADRERSTGGEWGSEDRESDVDASRLLRGDVPDSDGRARCGGVAHRPRPSRLADSRRRQSFGRRSMAWCGGSRPLTSFVAPAATWMVKMTLT